MDQGLGRLVDLVSRELDLVPVDVLAAARAAEAEDNGASSTGDALAAGAQLAEALWELLAARKPEAFWGELGPLTGVGYAYRYARRRMPEGLAPVDLSACERTLLRTTRRQIAAWSAIARWPSVRHVMFSADCLPLDATIAVRRSYSGGFAFTWHKGLRHTALYPARRIGEYRSQSAGTLVSVLLHEEFHLATAAPHDTSRFGEIGWRVYESAAQLVQLIAALICAGFEPTRGELNAYLEEIGWTRLLDLIDATSDADVPGVVRDVAALAVAAPAGDKALEALLGANRAKQLRAILST